MTLLHEQPVWAQPGLAILHRISLEIAGRLELSELMGRILRQIVEALPASSASLALLDAGGAVRHTALAVEGGPVRQDEAHFMAEALERGLAGWVRDHREPVLIPNTAADPRWYVSDGSLLINPKAIIAAPILGRERVLGVLTAGRLGVGSLGPGDLAVLTAIASLASVAFDNADLLAAERRERELSQILRQVARIVNSSLDLSRVLALVLEQLWQVVPYDSAAALLLEGDRLVVAAARGFAGAERVTGLTFSAQAGLAARVLADQRTAIVVDVQADPAWQAVDHPDLAAIRAWIGAPLIAQGKAVGVLTVDRRTPGSFTPADGRAAAALAEQAAVAVFNARLYARSEHRAYGLRALANTAQAINSAGQLDEVLRLVVRYAQEWLGMEGASLALISGDSLVFKETAGPVAERLRGASIPLGAGIAGWVAQRNEPIVVPDVAHDARFFGGIDEQTGFVSRALACVPVRIQGRAIGVIEVVNPASGEFDPETLELLDSLASLAGTAIVQAQRMAELQAAESRFAGLFEDSIDPILITDLDGLITDANRRACGFLGYQRAELVGLKVTAVHRVRTDTLTAGRFASLLNGQPIHYQTRITTRAGQAFPVEVHAKLIERGGQKFVQWIQHDLSERIALEELRSDLMSMVVHDLRSPLANIISALDILRTALAPDNQAQHALLAIAERAAGRMTRLVDSLLDVRRLEAGEMVLRRFPVEVRPLLAEALEQAQPAAAGKQLGLAAQVPQGLPLVMIDEELLRRVLANLLDNAVKYTPAGGRVELTAQAGLERVVVSVHDTGPGVPAADKERIFEKFTRVQRDSGAKGLGLGLAFCKLAVEAHGGRIWADSDPAGGATFSFTMPVARPGAKAGAAEAPPVGDAASAAAPL